jgi:Holliday junction resolvasome RuvABC DNA-binding subunit
MDEKDIHHAFMISDGEMTYRRAVLLLQKLGYDAKEADQIVSEWADDAEARIASDGAEEEYR